MRYILMIALFFTVAYAVTKQEEQASFIERFDAVYDQPLACETDDECENGARDFERLKDYAKKNERARD